MILVMHCHLWHELGFCSSHRMLEGVKAATSLAVSYDPQRLAGLAFFSPGTRDIAWNGNPSTTPIVAFVWSICLQAVQTREGAKRTNCQDDSFSELSVDAIWITVEAGWVVSTPYSEDTFLSFG